MQATLVRYESVAVQDELIAHQYDVNTFSSETNGDPPASSIRRSASTKLPIASTVDRLGLIAHYAGLVDD